MVASAVNQCILCGLPIVHPVRDESTGRVYCCPACREVDGLLREEEREGTIPAVIEEASVALEQITLSLGDMWCSSCSWLISESLRRAPGVQSAEVSFTQREARVAFDPDRTGVKRLIRQVKRVGYRAWPPDDPPPFDEEEAHATRLLIGGVLAMHVMLLSLFLYIREVVAGAPQETAWLAGFFQIMLFAVSVPTVLVLGIPILRAGFASLIRGRPNMHTLITLGTMAAFGLSVRNLILGLDRVYFDTAAMLLFLVTLGRWFEIRAQKNSSQAVEKLWKRLPEEATWITAEGERRVPIDELPKGARVLVRPGERFPVDGLIAAGEGDVDESLLTGEALPVTRTAGDVVLAGTVSLDGAFEIITSATGAGTVAGQIGRLLHQALWERAPVERLADRLAAWMVPAAVAIAGGTFAYWTARAGSETGLLHALSVLLIACPCALGIATPLTLWVGLGRAGEGGVILRGSSALERLDGVRHVFFDKTGTLTQRQFHLQVIAANGTGEDAFLAEVAAVELPSEHPLGQAIVAAARERQMALAEVEDFRAWPGQGVSGTVKQTRLWVGSRRLMLAQGFDLSPELAEVVGQWQREGKCVVYAGQEKRIVGLLGLSEDVRLEAVKVVQGLQEDGLPVSVLTGDDAAAGQRWERLLGVPVFAEQRPEDKIAHLHAMRVPVAMVGDGINDGPALAAADVGITLRHGTDVALDAADVILLDDDLDGVPRAIAIARAAMRRVRLNLVWAFVYNLVGIGLAVTGYLRPIWAAAAMVASSLIVTRNALRLRNVELHYSANE